jgi:hypothetical protein
MALWPSTAVVRAAKTQVSWVVSLLFCWLHFLTFSFLISNFSFLYLFSLLSRNPVTYFSRAVFVW